MPSVLNIASVAMHADQDGRELAQHIAHRGRASLRFGVVRVRGGELLESRDQSARDEDQDEGDHQDRGDARARLDPVHRVEPFNDPYLVIHRLLRVGQDRDGSVNPPARARVTFLQGSPLRSERQLLTSILRLST